MSLIPKNWAEFQHYKDRSPIWIKLHRKLLDDFAFSRLPVDSRALAPLLWLLSSEYDDGKITAPIEEIAFRLRMIAQDLIMALKPLLDNGFFVDDSDALASCYQVAMPEKRERTSKRQRREDSWTVATATRPSDEAFDEFKKAYPKRKGGNPWKPAKGLFDKALKEGATLDQILTALKSGIGFDREKVGTEFIPQAVKWLRDARWCDISPDESRATQNGHNKPAGFYAGFASPELDAWTDFERRLGATKPRDKRGGWNYPTQWPPGYQEERAA